MSGDGRAHAAAIKAALEAEGLTVYPGGGAANPTFPYVALYTDAGDPKQTSLGQDVDQWVHIFQTTSVGTTHEQALWVASKVREALAGVRLTVTGWNNSRIENIMTAPVASDYDAPTNIRYKFDQWRYRAVPSA